MKKNLLRQKYILLFFAFVLFPYLSYSQVPTCDPNVPYYFIDLTGKPAGTWVSPSHSRNGKCCGATGFENCTSFEIKTDANAAQISFNVASGAMPTGALFYQINCGPQVPVGEKICLSGIGPHRITFCKPGNNENTYVLTSYPKPIFPQDTTVTIGCVKNLPVLGIAASSVSWTSIYPGTQGQYDSYLSCTDCLSPVFTPIDGAPAYIDYKICGFPGADECGFNFTVCDTVRVTINERLTGITSPSPASFCQTGPGSGVNLTVNPSGGNNNYTYTWRNSSSNIIGTNQNYFATVQGNYTVEIRDGLYNSSTCPSTIVNVIVTEVPVPIVNAGADQTVCAIDARANLNGSVTNVSGGTWSGGNGIFSPDANNLTATYWPDNAEVASGSIKLILTPNNSGSGCPQVRDTVTINFPDPLQATINSGTINCSAGTTMLSASPSGGIPPYSYSWNTGSSSSSVSVPSGTFCVTVTDSLGCHITECKTITAPAPLSISMSSTNVTVNGGSDGTATADLSGGVPPYSYLWSNNSTTSVITGLPYGVYTVTATDSRGCAINGSIVVNEPRCLGFDISVNHTNLNCYGDANASATAIVTGGSVPYSYLWNDNNSQNTSTAVNLSDGTFTVIVTDAASCITSASITISMPSPIINTFTYADATNFSGNNGFATANPYGGTSPYSYSWGNGETSQTISNLTQGIYFVNITDNKGCTFSDSILINKDSCANLRTSVVSTGPSCFESSNGSATVFVNIGTAPYQYLWSNGSTTNTISGLSSGNYSVTVTDSTGCYSFKTFNVVQPTKLSLGLSPTDVICNGQNNGTIETTISGGTYPYYFTWSNGSSSEDLIYLAPDNYSVDILDEKGCAISGSTFIQQPAELSTTYTTSSPTCNAGADGSIDVTVMGGMVPYSYLWSNGALTQDLSNISSGLYTVVVTDANGCNLSTALDISVGQPAVVAVDSSVISCPAPGADKTTVVIIPSGGNGGPYQVSFDNGTSFQPAGDYDSELSVDSTYNVIVKDGNSCSSPAAYSLAINSNVIVQSVSFDKCFPENTINTSATVVPSGGDGGPYQISFDNGSTFGTSGSYSKDLLIGASHSIVVKDSSGCMSVPYSLQIPAALTASLTSSVFNGGFNISCEGNADGSITTLVAGGTQPVSYSWTGPGSYTSNLQSVTGLSAGNYSLTVTDSNGCTTAESITLNEPDALQSSGAVMSNYNSHSVSCAGSADGMADVTVAGGTTPYLFAWNNGETTQGIQNIAAGIYNVTVTDANGCQSTSSVTLTEPQPILGTTIINHVQCNGFATGSIDLTISGGVSPYTKTWSTGETSEDIFNHTSGTYSVTVTDNNLCTYILNASINEESPVILNVASTNETCFESNNGTAQAFVSGGLMPYTIVWSNGMSDATLSGLEAGVYTITVTDNNNCYKSETITVTQPDPMNAVASSPLYFNGHNVSYFQSKDGTIQMDVNGGTVPYVCAWNNGAGTKDLSGLPAGVYDVLVTDMNGCKTSASITLTQPDDLAIPTGISPNGDGKNDVFLVRGLEAYPDNEIVVVNRWGSTVFKADPYRNDWHGDNSSGEALPDGTYFVVVTINGGDIILKGYVDVRR